METIDERVKRIVVDQFQVNEADVIPSASFQKDLGAGSLDVVELVMRLEENFGITISDKDAESITTVKDAIDYVKKKQQNE
jgi:acyl carrier protein